jgi:hypothetical protein
MAFLQRATGNATVAESNMANEITVNPTAPGAVTLLWQEQYQVYNGYELCDKKLTPATWHNSNKQNYGIGVGLHR